MADCPIELPRRAVVEGFPLHCLSYFRFVVFPQQARESVSVQKQTLLSCKLFSLRRICGRIINRIGGVSVENGKQPRKRKDYTEQLCVDGKHFRSVTAFCEEYNLGYRTVLAHLKQGRSGADIVRIMLELPDIPKKNRSSRPVTHAGIEYPSLAEACRALQLKRGRVYNFLQRGISTEEALEMAIEAQKAYEGRSDGRSSSRGPAGNPCIIDGVEFQSRKDACAAFQLSYPSVMSRIQRHPEMPFEEALLRGARKWRYIEPVRQLSSPASTPSSFRFSSSHGDEPDLPLLLQIEELLVANGYGDPGDFLCEWDREPERWGIELDVYLHPPKDRKCVDICYERTSPGFVQSFQFFVCDFLLVPEGNMERCQKLINELHTEFAGVTLCILDETVRASGLYIASGQSFSGRQFMYALHRFLGTAAEMHSRFLEEFGAKSESPN